MKPRIAVLASGSGTTAEAYIRAGQNGDISSRVELVICNHHDAGIVQRIKDLNSEFGLSIQTLVINNKTHPPVGEETAQRGRQTVAEEAAILELLKGRDLDLIALMGYMKHVGPSLVKEFGWQPDYESVYRAKMVNTHPGLLPETQALYGAKIQQYVLDNDLEYGGQTLHLVAEEYDDGPIIAEHKVPVELDDTAETLFARIQAVEKQFVPLDIENFIMERREYLEQKGGA